MEQNVRSPSPSLAGPQKSDQGIIWVPTVLPDISQINGKAKGLKGHRVWDNSSGDA